VETLHSGANRETGAGQLANHSSSKDVGRGVDRPEKGTREAGRKSHSNRSCRPAKVLELDYQREKEEGGPSQLFLAGGCYLKIHW